MAVGLFHAHPYGKSLWFRRNRSAIFEEPRVFLEGDQSRMQGRRRASRKRAGARRRAPPPYRDIFDHASIGIYRSTPAGRILIANPALARMLGYGSVAEVLTLDLARDVYARATDRAPVLRMYTEQLTSLTSELEWKRKDGTPIWVLLNGRAVRDARDRVRYFEGFVQDITAARRAGEEVVQSRKLLRDLSRRLHDVREQERRRIAREIHDDLGQPLTALRMDLAWLRARTPADALPLVAKAQDMERLVDETIDKVRAIATELRPAVLDDLGLVPAIEGEADEWQRRTGVRCELDLPADVGRLDDARATTVFRVLQESLTNVARHARAARVRIQLRATPGEVVLEVSDDGRGITPQEITAHGSLGLLGMRERADVWGGELGLHGVPGRGTTVTLCLPRQTGAASPGAP